MTEDKKHLDTSDTNDTDDTNDEFDKQLRATAHEMREQMQPDSKVCKDTLSAVQAGEPAQEVPFSQVQTQPAQAQPLAEKPGIVTGAAGTRKRRRGRVLGIAATAAATVLVIIGGVAVYNTSTISLPAQSSQSAVMGDVARVEADNIFSPASYEELYKSLESRGFSPTVVMQSMDALSEGSPDAAAASSQDAPMSVESADAAQSPVAKENATASGDYSQTNTQVAGVDEADIVKTDGKNIYSLVDSKIVIANAAGKDTEEIARINISNGSVQDMYITDNRLVVMSYESIWQSGDNDYYCDQMTYVTMYDISDPSDPQQLAVLGQDGVLETSRLVDGILYVASNYIVYSNGCDSSEPQTFAPNTYDADKDSDNIGSTAEPLSVSDIYIMPEYSSTEYTVITAIEVDKGTHSSKLAVLGSTDTIYMNEDNLYLASSTYNYSSVEPDGIEEGSTSEPGESSVLPGSRLFPSVGLNVLNMSRGSRSVADVVVNPQSYRQVTRIVRLALNDGHPDVSASTMVEGRLLNQFSLDEYENHLRAAVTVFSGSASTNSLVIFNSNLDIVGSIADMAPGERIYSARFTGPVGYMVTFRQTDPLFSLDLADPDNPKVMDELKIPGFSQYLHPYADGLLLGIGQDALETGRLTGYLKLSMFDVSNPFDISEKNEQLIEAYSSDALTNHKAVLINEEKNIIGFAATVEYIRNSPDVRAYYETNQYYMVYGYDESSGFIERAAIELPGEFEPARALFIGEYLYVVNGKHIGVFDLDTLKEVNWVTL